GNRPRTGSEVDIGPLRTRFEERNRLLHEHFGFRTRIERRRAEREVEPPEFAPPDDAADRLAGEPPLRVLVDGLELVFRRDVALAPHQRHGVEPEGDLPEQAGIEIGGLKTGGTEAVAHLAPGGADSDRGGHAPSMAASCA